MVSFEDLLELLGREYGANFVMDEKDICQLSIDGSLSIQLMREPNLRNILISSRLGELGAGKVKEYALEEALKENANIHKIGTFCYISKTNELAVFKRLLLENITPDEGVERISDFINGAIDWSRALKSGNPRP